jgi:hypothetical protein
MREISFDSAKVKALRKAYRAACDAGRESFEFEGATILVSYAKYMLEYLTSKGL